MIGLAYMHSISQGSFICKVSEPAIQQKVYVTVIQSLLVTPILSKMRNHQVPLEMFELC
jgi:hypothetical protein